MKHKAPEQSFSEEELRDLLMRQKDSGREARIRAYRSAGRVVYEDDAPINEELIFDPNKKKTRPRINSKEGRKLDRILLLVEVIAVLGIIVLLGKSTAILESLNREAAKAFLMPTLTPTPLIHAVVLPGGHTAPDTQGETSFNEDEIPEHLRGLFDFGGKPSYEAPAGSDPVVRIRIAAINVDAPVVRGDDWESLKTGVGMNAGSGEAGKSGNLILSGHNDVFGQVFRRLDELQPGDEVMLLTGKRSYTYIVSGTQIVDPSRVDVLEQTTDSTLTLISCYPYMVDNQRIIVTAKLRD